MLPLRLLSQTAHKSCIEPSVISPIPLIVPAGRQRQGVHVLRQGETTCKQLLSDHLRKNALLQRAIIVRQPAWFLSVPRWGI